MSRNETIALLLASVAACSVFVGAGVFMAAPTANSKPGPAPSLSLETSISELLSHLRTDPRDGDGLKRLGALYAENGQLKEAVSAYVAASMERPGDREIERALMELQVLAQQKGKH